MKVYVTEFGLQRCGKQCYYIEYRLKDHSDHPFPFSVLFDTVTNTVYKKVDNERIRQVLKCFNPEVQAKGKHLTVTNPRPVEIMSLIGIPQTEKCWVKYTPSIKVDVVLEYDLEFNVGTLAHTILKGQVRL